MKIPLSCPQASYGAGMIIQCRKAGGRCGNQYFKRCKGWWALTEAADRCPLRKEAEHAEQSNA